jgi:cobalt-zinc-cadmium efflux system outer membrane protein
VLKSSGLCVLVVASLGISVRALAQAPPVAASAEPLRLTRKEAMDAALARNFSLIAAREQVEEARAQVVMAAAFPDPSVFADVTGQKRVWDPHSSAGNDQGVSVTVPFPGKTGLRRDVATAALKAAELNLTLLRQQVASQAAQAYDAILVAQRHKEDLTKSKAFAADFLEKTKARFLAGTVPKVDVIKAQVDVAQAENDLIANERSAATARATLNRLMGRLGGAPIDVAESLEVPPPLPPIENLETLAESSRPELQTLAAQLEGAKAATKLANKFWQPDLSLSVARNADQGAPTSYTSSISVGVPVLFWQHRNGEIADARHREIEIAANLSDIRTQISLDVQSAFANASTALRQAIFIRDELLPEAREVYRVASASYGLGGASALDLLDAKRTLVDAERQYADALGAANDAEAALELAIGTALPTTPLGDH